MAAADLVLEGGGAKLPGLIGAVAALTSADPPYSFRRIAGTSAGAIVGSMLAAGASTESLLEVVLEKDFSDFEDLGPILGRLPWLGRAEGLLFHKGMYVGRELLTFLSDSLAAQGVRTWGDLRQDDPGSALPLDRRYRLVVIVSDVSRGRMLRLPWDYRDALGVDPDSQSVAEAVCASAATPFFFRPRALPADPEVAGGPSILTTDGGLLSNYPVDVFDRHDGAPARWPTIGVKLSARETPATEWRANANTLQYAVSLISTMINAHDRRHVADSSATERTIFVDTAHYSSTDFDLSREDKLALVTAGAEAAEDFLDAWDWREWKKRHRRR